MCVALNLPKKWLRNSPVQKRKNLLPAQPHLKHWHRSLYLKDFSLSVAKKWKPNLTATHAGSHWSVSHVWCSCEENCVRWTDQSVQTRCIKSLIKSPVQSINMAQRHCCRSSDNWNGIVGNKNTSDTKSTGSAKIPKPFRNMLEHSETLPHLLWQSTHLIVFITVKLGLKTTRLEQEVCSSGLERQGRWALVQHAAVTHGVPDDGLRQHFTVQLRWSSRTCKQVGNSTHHLIPHYPLIQWTGKKMKVQTVGLLTTVLP